MDFFPFHCCSLQMPLQARSLPLAAGKSLARCIVQSPRRQLVLLSSHQGETQQPIRVQESCCAAGKKAPGQLSHLLCSCTQAHTLPLGNGSSPCPVTLPQGCCQHCRAVSSPYAVCCWERTLHGLLCPLTKPEILVLQRSCSVMSLALWQIEQGFSLLSSEWCGAAFALQSSTTCKSLQRHAQIRVGEARQDNIFLVSRLGHQIGCHHPAIGLNSIPASDALCETHSPHQCTGSTPS